MDHELLRQTHSLFLSAGHCDRDPGASGHDVTEADVVLELRDRLAARLRRDIVVTLDGEPGENLPLPMAVLLAKRSDVAVELHCNAFQDPRATGVETLSRACDYPLGERLCAAVADSLGIVSRGAKGEGDGRHSRLAFVRDGEGLLLELFFLTNADDLARYVAFQDELIEGLARVLIDAVCVPQDMIDDAQTDWL